MTQNNNRDSNVSAVPFFARYLEGQVTQEISTKALENINGGLEPNQLHISSSNVAGSYTLKYPSDWEESHLF